MISLSSSSSVLLVATEYLTYLSQPQQLSLSMKVLELSMFIKEKIDRLTVILHCLTTLMRFSLKSPEESYIYTLFSQGWFVEMWNSPDPSELREEIVSCLIEACLYKKSCEGAWVTVAFEVTDICCKVLDWATGMQERTYATSFYFLLLEDLCSEVKREETFSPRMQQLLNELIARFREGVEDTSLSSQFAKNLALLILAKYWQPSAEEELKWIVSVIRIRLFSTEMLGLTEAISVVAAKSVEYLLSSLFQFAYRYWAQVGGNAVDILESFIDTVEETRSSEAVLDLANRVLTVLNTSQAGNISTDEFTLLLERKNDSYKISQDDTNFFDCLDASFNIFLSSLPTRKALTAKPIEMLRLIQRPAISNWRLLPLKDLSGLADPIRVQCTHVPYPSSSLLVFCFKLHNTTNFQLTNIKLQSFISQNLDFSLNQRPHVSLRALSTLSTYDWKVRTTVKSPGPSSISMYIMIEDSNLPFDCPATYYSSTYTIPIPLTLLKDYSSFSSVNMFLNLWNRLPYSYTTQCTRVASIEQIYSNIDKSMQRCVRNIDGEGYRLAYLAGTWQGDRLAVYLTGTSYSRNIRVEARSNSEELISTVRESSSSFIGSLTSAGIKLIG